MDDSHDIIDWAYFEETRRTLGEGFVRILGYFREDGYKSLEAIEHAMHTQDTTALVIPAHTLKGESRQFGAEPLAEVAERIETTARRCIETGRFPDELVPDVVQLKRLFKQTIDKFDEAVSPLMQRKPQAGFGRKAANTGFGRAGS